MKELYWITTLSKIGIVSIVLSIVMSIIAIVIFLICVDDDNEEKLKKISIKTSIIGIVFLLVGIFIPNKEEMYLIYGIGSTIDYIKQNDKAKELPDKAILALDKWLDTINKE